MPPCGAARTVLDGVADARVLVTSCVTVAVAILEEGKWTRRCGYIVEDHEGADAIKLSRAVTKVSTPKIYAIDWQQQQRSE